MAPTMWQERTARFETALVQAWRDHRLAPLIFQSVGRAAQGGSGVRRAGGTRLLPSEYFWDERAPSTDHLARAWGTDIARAEAYEFLSLLAERCPIEQAQRPIAEEVDRVLASMSLRGLTATAIFAPARSDVLRDLGLQPGGDVSHLAAPEARHWHRGSFELLPVFSLQHPDAAEIWVVDFRALGTWMHPGTFDELFVHTELLRDRLVDLEGAMVPATEITALDYFAVEIDEPGAARGLRVPLSATGDGSAS